MESKIILILLVVNVVSSLDPWSHTGLTGPGPDEWAATYPLCNGSHQTPIDVPETTSYDSSLTAFNFVNLTTLGWDDMEIMNNGYSGEVVIKDASIGPAYFTGGGYSGKYLASRFHFHWGQNDTFGSEHTLQGKHFAAEVSMGFFKAAYGNISNSGNYIDGPTGLLILFKLSETDNPKLQPYISALENITHKGDIAPFGTSFDQFLPDDTSDFYQYNGSLPIPPCKEVVVWTVFKTPNTISSAQLAKLRQLYDSAVNATDPLPHQIAHNGRPIQPLNDRTVRRSFVSGQELTTPQFSSSRQEHDVTSVAVLLCLQYIFISMVPWLWEVNGCKCLYI